MQPLISPEELLDRLDRVTLLDVRWQLGREDGREQYLAGHVPGATSAPTTGNLDGEGAFLRPEQLAERFAALGVRPGADVGVYCGSGVTAAHEVAALAAAGIEAALWPGSWSQWSADPERPVATGG